MYRRHQSTSWKGREREAVVELWSQLTARKQGINGTAPWSMDGSIELQERIVDR